MLVTPPVLPAILKSTVDPPGVHVAGTMERCDTNQAHGVLISALNDITMTATPDATTRPIAITCPRNFHKSLSNFRFNERITKPDLWQIAGFRCDESKISCRLQA